MNEHSNEHSLEAARAQIESNAETARELIMGLGYTPATLEELGLSASELQKILYAKPEDGAALFKASRDDGTEAKAIIRSRPDRYIAADVFSPALSGGHGANHDFLWAELKDLLEKAKNDPTRKS